MLIVHSNKQPPCWDRLSKEFGVQWVPGIYVTYGAEIYCSNSEIPDEFLVHEMVHVEQQRGWDPDKFVDEYIADKEFRIGIEVPAFIVHNAYLRGTVKDEAELFTKLHRNLKSLSKTIGCSIEYADDLLAAYKSPKILP